jgi:hypothetical protein
MKIKTAAECRQMWRDSHYQGDPIELALDICNEQWKKNIQEAEHQRDAAEAKYDALLDELRGMLPPKNNSWWRDDDCLEPPSPDRKRSLHALLYPSPPAPKCQCCKKENAVEIGVYEGSKNEKVILESDKYCPYCALSKAAEAFR